MSELLKDGVEGREHRGAYIAPFRNQAKAVSWDVLRQYAMRVKGAAFNEAELRVDLSNGSRVQLFGADNAQALRGMHLDFVVMDEFAQMGPAVWSEVVRPALERKRGRAIFIGTPRGRNHFYKLYEFARGEAGWFADYWPASRCGEACTPPGQQPFTVERLEQLRREQGEDYYAQEYECSWEAAIAGAYYARALEEARRAGRIRSVAWEPAIPVSTWWDLGYTDETAILFAQPVGREWHVIDYYESSGHDLAHYVQVVRSKPYLYGTHHLPHDANQHELGSGKTLAAQAQMLGLKPLTVLAANDPLDGINHARLLFPRVWFDQDRCARLVDALASYRSEWDDKRQAFKDKPLHDWSSHAADAFRYFAVSQRDFAGPVRREPKGPARMAFDPMTFDRPQRKAPAQMDFTVFNR